MAVRTRDGNGRAMIARGRLHVQSPIAVEIDPRTAYDFVMSVCGDAGAAEDLLPEDRHWLEEARAGLPADLRAVGGNVIDCVGYTCELTRLIAARPEISTGRDVAVAIAAMTDTEIVETVLGELLETPELATLTRRAIGGSQAASSELRAILEQQYGAPKMSFDLAELGPSIRAAVAAWVAPFDAIEARVGRMEERDAASRRTALAQSNPLDLVEQATNGIRLVPDARLNRIVLAPTYFGRPFNNVSRIGDTQLICYPISDDALDAADRLAPPQAMLRLFRALGDESRLKILRLLSERDWYLTELATEIQLSKPTVKHHLAQLRSAGLVTMTEEGALTYYSLRRERLSEAGADLRTFLAR